MADRPSHVESDAVSSGKTARGRFASVWQAGRGWVSANRLKSVVICGVLVVIFGAVLWLAPSMTGSHSQDFGVTLDMALQALDDGRYVQAKALAHGLRSNAALPSDQLGGPAFVLGAATVREANEIWTRNKKDTFLLASRYLEEARDRGFPRDRRSQGLYLLGYSLYESGQYAVCRPHLRDAAEADPARDTEIHRLLSEAYASDANPRFTDALRHMDQYLADRRIPPEERADGLVRKSQILFGLGRVADCRSVLDEISAEAATSAEAVLMRGRLLLHEAHSIKQLAMTQRAEGNAKSDEVQHALAKFSESIQMFRQAQGRDTLGATTTRKAMYLMSVCYVEMSALDQQYRQTAQDQLQRTRKLHFDSPEGFAASLLEGDFERELERPKEAVASYRRTLDSVNDPRLYSNPWVSLNELRQRIMTAYRQYVDNRQFDYAFGMLVGFTPLFDKTRTIQLRARTANLWGESLAAEAEELSEEEVLRKRHLARKKFRRSGYMYAMLANKRIATRDYPDDLWNSANNFMKGHDFTSARNILQEYLSNEARRRRAVALVSLGKAHLALGDADEALKALRDCINYYPRDAAIYEAKLWCSKAYLELAMLDDAESLLLENLSSEVLTPASQEWRASLFALGQVFHEHGRKLYEQGDHEGATIKHISAVEKLEEAVTRYPKSPQVTEALYTIAEANRLAAQSPIKKYSESTIESARRNHLIRVRQLLGEALKYYGLLQYKLNSRQEEVELTQLEQVILRNCYMSVGAALSDLGRYEKKERYEEAIKAYSDASTRYQNEPIVLEAYLQIANCNRRLGRPFEARGTLAQAKVVLKRLKTSQPFEVTTNLSREKWQRLLDQLSTW